MLLTRHVMSGPLRDLGADGGLLGRLVAPFTPTVADGALEVALTADQDGVALGVPTLRLTYAGDRPDRAGPWNVFAQLVDEERGVVIGNQITPIRLNLDGRRHTARVELEAIAQHVRSGDSLTLQLLPATVAYALPILGTSVTFDEIEITIPIAGGLERA